MRMTGKVTMFADTKGYGFIEPDDGGDDVVELSAIAGVGFRSLEEGQSVECEIEESPRGLKAINVTEI